MRVYVRADVCVISVSEDRSWRAKLHATLKMLKPVSSTPSGDLLRTLRQGGCNTVEILIGRRLPPDRIPGKAQFSMSFMW